MVSWEPVPYAICYVIIKDGKVEGFTTATSCEYNQGAKYGIQAVNEYGGLSQIAIATVLTAVNGAEAHVDKFHAKAVYAADGKKLNGMAKGLNILTDGKQVRKVIRH